jgi:hypothetical protein
MSLQSRKNNRVKFRGGKWSAKYKRSIDCNNPKGFSQKQHCKYGRKTRKYFGGNKCEADYWSVINLFHSNIKHDNTDNINKYLVAGKPLTKCNWGYELRKYFEDLRDGSNDFLRTTLKKMHFGL